MYQEPYRTWIGNCCGSWLKNRLLYAIVSFWIPLWISTIHCKPVTMACLKVFLSQIKTWCACESSQTYRIDGLANRKRNLIKNSEDSIWSQVYSRSLFYIPHQFRHRSHFGEARRSAGQSATIGTLMHAHNNHKLINAYEKKTTVVRCLVAQFWLVVWNIFYFCIYWE